MSSAHGKPRPPAQPRRWPWIVATVVMFFIAVGACGADAAPTSAPAAPTPPATSTVTVTVPAVAPPYTGRSGDPTGGDLDDDDTDAPSAPAAPRRTSRSSDSSGSGGHLCLPGERDGDGDGFCGEGR